MSFRHLTQPLHNERGILTVDFMFSIVLILGLSGLLFAMCFALSVASVTQYVTFAAARNYTVGHITTDDQIKQANAKYAELISNPVMKPLYNNGWFSVDGTPGVGDHTTLIPGYQEATQGVNKFWGVSTTFRAKVLAMKIPFFGDTTIDGDETGEGFKATLGSYLGREVTTQECLALTAQRWNQIKKLGPGYGTQDGKYFPQADDGC